MPFDEQSLADFQHAYDRAIQNINELDGNLKIELFTIMSHQGESVDIVPKMINQIDECSIFIADISEANPNVAYELGLAKGKTKSLIFVQNVDDKSKVPFDYTQTSRHVYTSFDDLTNKITQNIKVILESQGYNFN
jgi:nucleoside 2-deoxyribosyltransferase